LNLEQPLRDPAFDEQSQRSDRATKQSDDGFQDLNLDPNLVRGVSRLNFKQPTPVQMKAIPIGLRGDDILATAQTGSGKTLAFGLPMLQRLSQIKRSAGLVIVPTRELAIQVEQALRDIGRLVHVRSVVLIGGASIIMQQKALRKNPRVIIATPGRLMDHIDRKNVNLDNIMVLVLDEADRMLDMGFAPDIKKIMKSIPEKRQTMLFSATMPKEIEALAQSLMSSPTRIEISRSGATPVEVSHEMFMIPHRDKSRLLALQLQRCKGPVLVFTRTKRMASRLTEKVKDMGFAAAEIHSNRSQGQRQAALDGFKRGRFQVLIATDIAARGIDVTGIELVVNYDMPANSEDYVHRIGRTGRAGKTGHAVSFATADQKRTIGSIERFMKTTMAISAVPSLPSERRLMERAGRRPERDPRSEAKRFSRPKTSTRTTKIAKSKDTKDTKDNRGTKESRGSWGTWGTWAAKNDKATGKPKKNNKNKKNKKSAKGTKSTKLKSTKTDRKRSWGRPDAKKSYAKKFAKKRIESKPNDSQSTTAKRRTKSPRKPERTVASND
jgi:ATP-dependent RNA helicase RhlE